MNKRMSDQQRFARQQFQKALQNSAPIAQALAKVSSTPSRATRVAGEPRVGLVETLERRFDQPIRRLRASETTLLCMLGSTLSPDDRHVAHKELKHVRTRLSELGRERNVFLRENGIDFKYRVV